MFLKSLRSNRPEILGRRHVAWAVTCAVAIVLAFVTPPHQAWSGLCIYRAIIGYPCPFCGTGRGVHDMAHGRIVEALHNSPLSVVVFLTVVVAMVWSLGQAWRGSGTPGLEVYFNQRMWISIILLIALNWMYRLFAGLQ